MTSFVAQLDRLTNATTVEDVWSLHVAKMECFGFDRIMYGFTRYRSADSLGDPQDWMLLSTQTPEYMSVFFGEGLYRSAPMIKWAMANDGVCSWRIMSDPDWIASLSCEEKRVVDFNRSMQVTAGYTISFHSLSQRSKGAVSLVAAPDLTQDDIDSVWAEHGDTITVMNNVMHLKLMSLPHVNGRPLTRRQREVLQWVGDGKSVQDTAQLLGLTPATVEKHLRLARETLDVTTTAQGVLKAAFYNQMFLIDGSSVNAQPTQSKVRIS